VLYSREVIVWVTAMNILLRVAVTAVAAVLVVACGGGGGSSAITPTADITADNALVITQEVMATTVAANTLGDQTGIGAFSATASALGGQQTLASVTSIAQGYFLAGSASVQASAVTPQVQELCDFGGTVDIDPISDVSVKLIFTDCNGFGDLELQGIINGVMTLTINSENPLDISVVFSSFAITGDLIDSFQADGSIRVRLEDLTGAGEIYHDKLKIVFSNFTAMLEDKEFLLPRLDYTIEEYFSDNENWIKEAFSGSLEGDGISFSGIVNFNTVVPFKYDFNVGDFGAYTEGEMFISGAGGKEIHIAVDPGADNLLVEIDTDGDGEYDYFPTWTMEQIASLGV